MNSMIQGRGLRARRRSNRAPPRRDRRRLLAKLKEGETLLIVTNPEREVLEIAAAHLRRRGRGRREADPHRAGVKTQTDYAEEA